MLQLISAKSIFHFSSFSFISVVAHVFLAIRAYIGCCCFGFFLLGVAVWRSFSFWFMSVLIFGGEEVTPCPMDFIRKLDWFLVGKHLAEVTKSVIKYSLKLNLIDLVHSIFFLKVKDFNLPMQMFNHCKCLSYCGILKMKFV